MVMFNSYVKLPEGSCDGLWSKMTKVWPTCSVLSWKVTSLHYTWFVLGVQHQLKPILVRYISTACCFWMPQLHDWYMTCVRSLVCSWSRSLSMRSPSLFHPFSATRKCCPFRNIFGSWFQLWCFTSLLMTKTSFRQLKPPSSLVTWILTEKGNHSSNWTVCLLIDDYMGLYYLK